MPELSAATVLLQWAGGGLLFTWVTTRHRHVGLGYGWMMRITFGLSALGALAAGLVFDPVPLRDLLSAATAAVAAAGLAQSIQRRSVGVRNQRVLADERTERVAQMTGIDRGERAKSIDGAEFDPRFDLVAGGLGLVGVVITGLGSTSPALTTGRLLFGSLFLGAVTAAMLLGHWYLVQPGLDRRFLSELVRWTGIFWLPVVGLLLVPTGMQSVLSGSIDDGWGGMLGWFWVACAVTTIALVGLTTAALRERQYSAVMAATGLLYLAILTAFGTDLVARALLASA